MAKFDIYEAVTERIIHQLQQGVIPWQKPWTGTQHGAISGTTGKPYSLLNQMLLSLQGCKGFFPWALWSRLRSIFLLLRLDLCCIALQQTAVLQQRELSLCCKTKALLLLTF